MKNNYKKLKISLSVCVSILFVVGLFVITYIKADEIKNYPANLINTDSSSYFDLTLFLDAANELKEAYFIALLVLIIIILGICKLINYTYRKEQQLIEEHKQLTRAVAHELKTPLSIINSYNDIDSSNDIINNEITHMNNMVLELIEHSNLNNGELVFNDEKLDLYLMINNVIKRYTSLSSEKNIMLNIICEQETFIKADIKLILQIFNNFITNAIKNTPENGKIDVTVNKKSGKYRIEVSNSGSSIDNDIKDDIWKTFYKGDKSREHAINSTGIGLSICKLIFDNYKDNYGCDNTEDGVVFWFEHKIYYER